MSGLFRLARSGAWAHRRALIGTGAILALAGALLSLTGVVLESGVRQPRAGGLLVQLAESFAGTLLLVVVFVVAGTVSLLLRRRRREFALLLAVGATRRQVRGIVGAEVALLTLLAAPLGALTGLAVAPLSTGLFVRAQVVPAGFGFNLTPLPVLAAVVVLLPVALVAGWLAARQTVRIPPTVAVRESTVEPPGLSTARRVTALVLAVAGLPVALTPLVVPGIEGSAGAATSAFLLICAAGLAGPLLVGWAFDRTETLQARFTGAPVRLALANSRGFTRRLTTVIVPLAVALSVATVQTGVDRSVAVATSQQLRDGIQADLVVPAGALSPDRLPAVAKLPGVSAVEPTTTVPARVRTDSDAPSGLAWEYTQLRAVSPVAGLLDPQVRSGSLGALASAGTVAISSDARLDLGRGIGSRITIRAADGVARDVTVVAVFQRGLAFGDYLIGPSTLRELAPGQPVDTVLLRTDPGSAAGVVGQLRELGLDSVDAGTYVRQAVTAGAAMQHLSALLLLTLLVFVVLAAANIVVLTAVGRRRELALLHRTGATRRQLLAMCALESLLTSSVAWVVGTVAVIPALLGVNYGLTGAPVPRIDWTSFGLVSLVVLALPLLGTVPVVLRQFPARSARSARSRVVTA